MIDNPTDEIKNKLDESDDQIFIGNQNYEEEIKAQLDAAFNNLLSDIADLKNQLQEAQNNKGVLPDVKKRRDLDIETGGVEGGIKGTTDVKEMEQAIKDVWDGRSEEVDKMAVNVFETSGMRSVVDRKKKERLAAIKHAKDMKKNPEAASKDDVKGDKKSEVPEKMSFLKKISKMKEDRSHEEGASR